MIHISPKKMDTPIYRVFSKYWLIEALTKKKNALVKPQLWDDPFENFIFKLKAKTKRGDSVSFESIRESFYGQCWTFSVKETDALWRIYSPKKDGFRVKTTIRKMFETFYDIKNPLAMTAFYVGRILYEDEVDIKTFFEDSVNLETLILDQSGNGQIETLLVKRLEFEHENELRLILAADKSWIDTTQNSYEFPIDINFHFEEILADPRMDDDDANCFSNSVKEIRALGYTNPIEKSKLYQIPNLNLRLNIN